MEEEKQYWSMDELLSITETVQEAEVEFGEKFLKIQWCELTEAEEPKMALPDDNAPSEEQTEYYKELAADRVLKMIEKANEKEPETATITADNYKSLPTTLRWQISSLVLGQTNENFTTG